jgi:AbrB family looped-hinge helix DNA binding protein
MSRGFGEERQVGLTGVPAAGSTGLNEDAPVRTKLKIGPGGRVVIPAAMREKLGVNEGDMVMASVEDGEMRLISLMESVRRAQAMVRKVVPAGVSLVDELLEDRRQEVLNERKRG